MDDAAALLAGHTTKYNIPLSHFERKYIENCTDGKELERIYKELTGGEIGSFADLERFTLDRIRLVKPTSQVLRKDKPPLDKSALSHDERQQLDDFLNQMKAPNRAPSAVANDHQNNGLDSVPIRSTSIVSKPTNPAPAASVINNGGKQKRIVPRSYDEWGKLDQKLSRDSNSDSEDDEEEDDHKHKEKPTNKSQPSNSITEKSQRLQMAEQHRLTGNTAFQAKNYQQSIDLYTKSILLDSTNTVCYMNRAQANYKLNSYDSSIEDCSHVLSGNSQHIKALFRRASCHIAKQQHDAARRDLDVLLTVDPTNDEAKNLLQTIPTIEKPKSVRIPITEDNYDEEEEVVTRSSTAPLKISIFEVDEEEEEEEGEEQVTTEAAQSMSVDIPRKSNIHTRPGIDSQEASPAMFDHHFHHHPYQQNIDSQRSSQNADADDEDEDDMALGDEAGAGLMGNMSDDDVNVSHSLNVSPTMEDDDEVPELLDHKLMQTPPARAKMSSDIIDQSIAYTMNENYHQKVYLSSTRDDTPLKANSISTNSFEPINYDDERSSQPRSSTKHYSTDQISTSNFSPMIQSWLRDLVQSQSDRRPSSSSHDKLWSRSSRPNQLDKLQRDIERFHRSCDYKNAIEASKKMLKNGLLDYHNHADHIVSVLVICAQCYSKSYDHVRAIQYATEALQYNRSDTNALLCRAKAFENEKFLLLSYADYARVPSNDFNHPVAQHACEQLANELKTTESDTWREKLSEDKDDDERYLTYIQTRDKSSSAIQYDWYRERGNQLYMDACFVLAIRCYTYCIELKPDVGTSYSNRAACYLKVFEPQKTIDDCEQALKIDPKNVRALYRKACAHKMSRNDRLYQLILKDLIKMQPNNQTILAEYYNSRHEPIPRRMKRIRIDQKLSTVAPSPSSDITKPTSRITVEENYLSYEELERIRAQKPSSFSGNTSYQFKQQLETLKTNDTKGQCLLLLRIAPKSLYKLVSTASPKLVETMIQGCRTMVDVEKHHQQEHRSSILTFSYLNFCFNLLVELTSIPRLDSTLSMLDQYSRASLDDLLSYFSSISSVLNDIQKLERLRK